MLLRYLLGGVFFMIAGVAVSAPDVIGRLQWHQVSEGDTLVSLARRYKVGYDEILRANPVVDVWLPLVGKQVLLPTQHVLTGVGRRGVVINLAERRLFLFEQNGSVFTAPIGIGREGWRTPLTTTRVQMKQRQPTWYPPASIRDEAMASGRFLPDAVPPGPENPLGLFSVRLALPGYLIHGTNRPAGVGMRVSHGCIRLYPGDIQRFFKRVSVGTPVNIIDQPYKLGWLADELWLEAHPVAYQSSKQSEAEQELRYALQQFQIDQGVLVDWARVDDVLLQLDGVPVRVGWRSSPDSH